MVLMVGRAKDVVAVMLEMVLNIDRGAMVMKRRRAMVMNVRRAMVLNVGWTMVLAVVLAGTGTVMIIRGITIMSTMMNIAMSTVVMTMVMTVVLGRVMGRALTDVLTEVSDGMMSEGLTVGLTSGLEMGRGMKGTGPGVSKVLAMVQNKATAAIALAVTAKDALVAMRRQDSSRRRRRGVSGLRRRRRDASASGGALTVERMGRAMARGDVASSQAATDTSLRSWGRGLRRGTDAALKSWAWRQRGTGVPHQRTRGWGRGASNG